MFEELEGLSCSIERKNVYIYHSNNKTIIKTYQQLFHNADLLIKYLIQYKSKFHVALYMKNSFYIPLCIYSLIKCKLPFIMLDTKASHENNYEILKHLNIYVIISNKPTEIVNNITRTIHKVDKLELEDSILYIYFCLEKVELHNYLINNNDICYIIQTSGTLGTKKYVKVTKTCIESNVNSLRKKFDVTISDIIYFGTPFTFDPCMVELFLALTTGATLFATSNSIRLNRNKLFHILFPRIGVTIVQMCPSVFLQWNDEQINFILNKSNLRILALGGEPFPTNIMKFYQTSAVRIYNLYGITEVSCWASIALITDEIVNLGEVLNDTVFQVRRSDSSIVSKGEGHLFIGSRTRLCYINNEISFPPDTIVYRETGDIVSVDNNIYHYIGRQNDIIKRYGHRICLNQLDVVIENALTLKCKSIWIKDLHKIVTFVCIDNYKSAHKEKILDKIRVQLLKHIEKAQFPDAFDLINQFPLTINGKIDSHELKKLAMNLLTPSKLLSLSEAFKVLWCRYLGITIEELLTKGENTFTELGGTSILFKQLINEVELLSGKQVDLNYIIYDTSFNNALKYLNTVERSSQSMECASHTSERFKIAWKYDLQACVDTKVTISKCREYIGIGNFSQTFFVFNANTGVLLSNISFTKPIESACLFSDDSKYVYVGCFDGNLYCLRAENCNVLWKFQTGDRIKNKPCLCLKDEAIAFGSYDGCFYCLNRMSGVLLWKYSIGEAITSHPKCFNNNRIFISSIKGAIYCLNVESGSMHWKYKAKNPIFVSSHKTDDNSIIFLDLGGILYCFEPNNGILLWSYQLSLDNTVYSKFIIFNNFLILGTQNRLIMLKHDQHSCIELASIIINHEIIAKPVLFHSESKNFIIIVATDGYILLYELFTDKLMQVDQMTLNSKCFACPVLCNGKIFIGCRDNHLYCIEMQSCV